MEVTVKQLAEVVKRPIESLLSDLSDAGINKTNESDLISDYEKVILLTYLQKQRNLREDSENSSTHERPKIEVKLRPRKKVTRSKSDLLKEEAPPYGVEDGRLTEKHFTIPHGATGYTYHKLFFPYLTKATSVIVEDPYILKTHQIQNFVRFCELLVKEETIKNITLITKTISNGESKNTDNFVINKPEPLYQLKESLEALGVKLSLEENIHLHDREIRMDNGWVVKIGRGLDFYLRPDSYFGIGAYDLGMRPCLETKVDIYKL